MLQPDYYPKNEELQVELLAASTEMFNRVIGSVRLSPGWLADKPLKYLHLHVNSMGQYDDPFTESGPNQNKVTFSDTLQISVLDPGFPKAAKSGHRDAIMRNKSIPPETLDVYCEVARTLGELTIGGLSLPPQLTPMGMFAHYERRSSLVGSEKARISKANTFGAHPKTTALESALAFAIDAQQYLFSGVLSLHPAMGFKNVVAALIELEPPEKGESFMWHTLSCDAEAPDLPLSGAEPHDFLQKVHRNMQRAIQSEEERLQRIGAAGTATLLEGINQRLANLKRQRDLSAKHLGTDTPG